MRWAVGRRARVGIAATSVVALGLVSLMVVASSSGVGGPTCHDRKATIVGTSGNDVIEGTNGSDVIVARAGNDQVDGRGGDDYICGNAGRDILLGGSGDDNIYAGNGDDAIFAGSGDDNLFGESGSDQLHGGSGEDYMVGDLLLPYRGDSCDGGDGTNDTALGDCESKPNVP
jgi:Ca2+-binding RTX toxin-like protein